MIFDPHHEEDMKIVKRVVGLPGDTLAMRFGALSVNGVELEEPYLNAWTGPDQSSPDFEWQRDYLTADVDAGSYSPSLHNWGPLVVPADHYFMMGDNRDASLDSRFWGPLAGWRLEARVSFLYFSYNSESYRPFPALREIRWNRLGRSTRAISGG
jgi:signal peptidase I